MEEIIKGDIIEMRELAASLRRAESRLQGGKSLSLKDDKMLIGIVSSINTLKKNLTERIEALEEYTNRSKVMPWIS